VGAVSSLGPPDDGDDEADVIPVALSAEEEEARSSVVTDDDGDDEADVIPVALSAEEEGARSPVTSLVLGDVFDGRFSWNVSVGPFQVC
jgi:uncharacterized protein YdaT